MSGEHTLPTLSPSCEHRIDEQDVAIHVDGLCPICVAAERDRLRAEKAELVAAIEGLKFRIDTRLNDWLCEMKPDYDDSIVGFNEAWDIVRKVFAAPILAKATATESGQ